MDLDTWNDWHPTRLAYRYMLGVGIADRYKKCSLRLQEKAAVRAQDQAGYEP